MQISCWSFWVFNLPCAWSLPFHVHIRPSCLSARPTRPQRRRPSSRSSRERDKLRWDYLAFASTFSCQQRQPLGPSRDGRSRGRFSPCRDCRPMFRVVESFAFFGTCRGSLRESFWRWMRVHRRGCESWRPAVGERDDSCMKNEEITIEIFMTSANWDVVPWESEIDEQTVLFVNKNISVVIFFFHPQYKVVQNQERESERELHNFYFFAA